MQMWNFLRTVSPGRQICDRLWLVCVPLCREDHTHPRRHHCRRQLAFFVTGAGERDGIHGDCASPDAHSNCSGLFIQHDAGIPAGELSGVAHFYVSSRTERASRQAGRVLRIRAEQCPRVLDLQHGLHHTRNDRSSTPDMGLGMMTPDTDTIDYCLFFVIVIVIRTES